MRAVGGASSGVPRRDRRARRPRPRTGSARADCPRRWPPRGRASAAAPRACTPCRRDSARARPGRGASGVPPCGGRARRARRRRGTGEAAARRGSVPSSSPSRKTASKRRVRTRRRSRTATRPRSPAEPSLTSAWSSAPSTSSAERSPPSELQPSSSSSTRVSDSNERRSARLASPTGGASRPCALRSIAAAIARAAATGPDAPRSASSGGSGWPSRRRIVSSSTLSRAATPRPRSRPSRKSTFERRKPE